MNFIFRNTGRNPLEKKQQDTETKRLQDNINKINYILESAGNLFLDKNKYKTTIITKSK